MFSVRLEKSFLMVYNTSIFEKVEKLTLRGVGRSEGRISRGAGPGSNDIFFS